MRIQWTPEKILSLRAALDACEDAEAMGSDEYVVDLYDEDPPLSLEIALCAQGVDVLAAETLAYDAELDGWYLAGPVEDARRVARALEGLL